MYIYKVKYQVATYSGEITVTSYDDLEREQVIARAKDLLRRRSGGSLPYGYESFKIVSKEEPEQSY